MVVEELSLGKLFPLGFPPKSSLSAVIKLAATRLPVAHGFDILTLSEVRSLTEVKPLLRGRKVIAQPPHALRWLQFSLVPRRTFVSRRPYLLLSVNTTLAQTDDTSQREMDV